MTVLLYLYFYNISLNALKLTFSVYIIYLFYALQISVKLGPKMGQKLTKYTFKVRRVITININDSLLRKMQARFCAQFC